MPKLAVDYEFCCAEIDRLSALQNNLESVSAEYRKLIAEIVMLRLFYLFQNAVASIATKMICGATYLDGTSPTIITPARSAEAARQTMITYGRARPRHNLKWSKVGEIKENVQYVLGPLENFVTILDYHGTFVDEMRRVRNRIAHNNPDARNKYRIVVKRHYGAFLNSVTPGTLLLSPRRSPPLLEQYLSKTRVLMKQIVRAS